jgi:Rrf2 family protein
LSRHGFLESQRGVKGGYYLTRDPAAISVLELIQALDGPVFITQCSDHGADDCAIECHCPVSGRWRKINDAIVGAMRGITLRDMIQYKSVDEPVQFKQPSSAPAAEEDGRRLKSSSA